MKQNERALLQERVRTLVLRHALEATLSKMATMAGPEAHECLERLELAIVSAARNLVTLPSEMQLAALVAAEDAVATIRSAFDATHQRIETIAALAPKGNVAA